MKINSEKCTGCGECASVCFRQDIEMKDNKAVFQNQGCFHCGHCVAVCPAKAIESEIYSMEDVEELGNFPHIDGEKMLKFIKSRRSTRSFKKEQVSKETLDLILQAGRYSPTGSNLQDVSIIVVQDKIQELRKIVLEQLGKVADGILSDPAGTNKNYALMWKQMVDEFEKDPDGSDKLIFHAPTVLLVLSTKPISGHLAAAAMELTANACGLGALYSGFITMGLNNDLDRSSALLPIPAGKTIVTCLLLGHPAIRFKRTAPRKELDVCYL